MQLLREDSSATSQREIFWWAGAESVGIQTLLVGGRKGKSGASLERKRKESTR